MARYIAKAESLKEAYDALKEVGNVDGMDLPSYEVMLARVGKRNSKRADK